MNKRHMLAFFFMCLSATSSMAGPPAGSRPLTPEEMSKVVIGHTWTAPANGRPAVMTSAERKLYDQQKSKGNGQFREFYAPNGKIMGWVSRSDFDARIDGAWRINGNELCSSYRVLRVWKIGPLRATSNSKWCYRFVYQGSELLMGASRTPPGRVSEVGQYFRPKLSRGNSVMSRYNSISR